MVLHRLGTFELNQSRAALNFNRGQRSYLKLPTRLFLAVNRTVLLPRLFWNFLMERLGKTITSSSDGVRGHSKLVTKVSLKVSKSCLVFPNFCQTIAFFISNIFCSLCVFESSTVAFNYRTQLKEWDDNGSIQ